MKKFPKRCLLLFQLLFSFVFLPAQNYLIHFTGSGLTTMVSSVEVTNLSQNTSLTLAGNDILHLTSNIGVFDNQSFESGRVKVYPNPNGGDFFIDYLQDFSTSGEIEIIDVSGRVMFGKKVRLQAGINTFKIGGAKQGVCIIRLIIDGESFSRPVIVLPSGSISSEISIDYFSNASLSGAKIISGANILQMQYNSGELLLFKGISSKYTRVCTLVPQSDQGLNFHFIDCTDGDNNHYPVVTIDDITWMASNLKTTKNRSGINLQYVGDGLTWLSMNSPGYCWYNNDEINFSDVYGGLYNWYAIKTDDICPFGWRMPNDSDFVHLVSYLGGELMSGGMLKETGNAHWYSPNAGATNATGFSALPGGVRSAYSGDFTNLKALGNFWTNTDSTSTLAFSRVLKYHYIGMSRQSDLKTNGFSIRCIMDNNLPTQIKPIAEYIVSDTLVLVGDTLQFTDLSANSPFAWKWYFGDGDSSSLQHPTHAYLIPGFFDVTLLVSNSGGTDTLKKYYLIKVMSNAIGIPCTGLPTVTDFNGNVYNTIQIGNQCWIKENLRVMNYNDGTVIPEILSDSIWASLGSGARCWYNNDSASYSGLYGMLYNGYAAAHGNLCPIGWHVPTNPDWTILTDYLGGQHVAGGPLKDSIVWSFPNIGSTNSTGFSALPGGCRSYLGVFEDVEDRGFWYTSSNAYSVLNSFMYGMSYNYIAAGKLSGSKNYGNSVRCIKD